MYSEKSVPTHSRKREVFLRAMLVLLSPLVFACLLEGTLRLVDAGYDPHFWTRIGPATVSNDRFGWRFFPASLARTPVPARIPSPKRASTFRIFVLGESAAMGFPEPGFSFGRVLETMLQAKIPQARFEVINAAMTAINSNAVLPIARDCLQQSPDLLVIYMGNNEVIGPFGAGTVFGNSTIPLRLVRLAVWLGQTRTGQLFRSVIERSQKKSGPWRGMEMFLDKRLGEHDPRLQTTYHNFSGNLAAILEEAALANVPVVLSTVAVNLRDQPPFASAHQPSLSSAQIEKWEALSSGGIAAARAGLLTEAEPKLLAALDIDPDYADTHFQLARVLEGLGRAGAAKQHFVRARDLDQLRFRADSRLNDEIRAIAATRDRRVTLVDTDRELGVTGNELFHEHVHLNFKGNYVVAKALLRAVERHLPEQVRSQSEAVPVLREDECAKRLGLVTK